MQDTDGTNSLPEGPNFQSVSVFDSRADAMAARAWVRTDYPVLEEHELGDGGVWIHLSGPNGAVVPALEHDHSLDNGHVVVLSIPYKACQSLWAAWPWYSLRPPVEDGVVALHVCLLRHLACMAKGVAPAVAAVRSEGWPWIPDPNRIVPPAKHCVCFSASICERLELFGPAVENANIPDCRLVSFRDLVNSRIVFS